MKVLIDGSDLVGKSSTCRAILERLKRENLNAYHLPGGRVVNNPVRKLLNQKFPSSRYPQNQTLNSAYIMTALLDRFLLPPDSQNQILLYESYVDRSVAYGNALNFGWIPKIALQFPSLFVSFDLAVFLYTSLAERRRRMIERTNRTIADELTTFSQEAHEKMEKAYRRMFIRHTRILSFDTSILSVDQITDEIVDTIKTELK